MSKEPTVLVIVTAAKCPHCVRMRGDGRLKEPGQGEPPTVPGGNHWSPTTMRKLLTASKDGRGQQKLRIFEVFLPLLKPQPATEAIEVSEFFLDRKNSPVQQTWIRKPDGGVSLRVNGREVKTDQSSFDAVVKTLIPSQLENFMYAFPLFMFVDGGVWEKSLTGAGDLFGYTLGVSIKKLENRPGYGVDPSQPYRTGEDLVTLAIRANNLEIDLLTPPAPKAVAPKKVETIPLPGGDVCRNFHYQLRGL